MRRSVLAFFITSGLAAAQSKIPASDWPMFNRDLAGTRFSPLKQINSSNVSQLKQAWAYKLNPEGKVLTGASPSEIYQEITPIVVNGVLYMPSGDRVVAVDPENGKELWKYQMPEGKQASFRGVAYWAGDKNNPPRVIFTSGKKMIGLNARTGKMDPGFGKEGEVTLDIAYDGAPIVYKNMLLLGTNFYGPGDRHINPALDMSKGEIPVQQGFDVRTGKKVWDFHTFPRKGEIGFDTWLKPGSQENRTGNNVWAFSMTLDEERGILYMPVSGPGANFYGGDRPGDNLFGNTLVAVDAETGKYKWHFQTVRHELWDYNLPPAPSLIDITVNGKKIPALAQVGKSGFMYILDRVTGKPIFGMEDKPVHQGDVPGEWYAKTQPIPVKPPPISRVSFTKDDIVRPEDTTAEHSKACHDLYDRLQLVNYGPYTPFPYHAEGAPNTGAAIVFPGFTGGANWGGTSVDPGLGYVFVNTKDAPAVGWMTANGAYNEGNTDGIMPFVRTGPPGANFSAAAREGDKNYGNLPCFRPPWGRMIAVNASTGNFAWEVPLGITDTLPEAKQHTGSQNSAGSIATAGGLVFVGATSDQRFRAFESKTGKELWVTKLDYNATAIPITYQGKNGKQYVAIIAATGGAGGGGGRGKGAPAPANQALVVYALP